MIKLLNIVGARPNFMKIAPIIEAMNRRPSDFDHALVHTGQHYDERMSRAFFEDLGLPRPDVDLEVGSASHAKQTGQIMSVFEDVCLERRPDVVLVVGDVNSTLACTLTAKKLGIAVAHVEAGLRSRDMTMPEEINRLATDVLSDYLFTTDKLAGENLRSEGASVDRIHFVGNVMIDTLLKHRDKARDLPLLEQWGLRRNQYATLTLHRPSNVDDPAVLKSLIGVVEEVAAELPIVFPVHPRTRKRLEDLGLGRLFGMPPPARGLWACEPLGYLEFLHLNQHSRMVMTDSGGLQEETTALGVPCLTLRPNTERPITCSEGTNQLVGNDPQAIRNAARKVLNSAPPNGRVPELWDGHAAERVAEVLLRRSS